MKKELENLKAIKKWLKGKKLPASEKDILRQLINIRIKEIKHDL